MVTDDCTLEAGSLCQGRSSSNDVIAVAARTLPTDAAILLELLIEPGTFTFALVRHVDQLGVGRRR